jgi:hypothetical protein
MKRNRAGVLRILYMVESAWVLGLLGAKVTCEMALVNDVVLVLYASVRKALCMVQTDQAEKYA